MRDILLTLIIAGSLPVMFVRPFFGLLMWCWVSYMLPHRLTYGFAQDKPWAMIVGLTFLISYLLSKEPKKLPITAVSVSLIVFVLWMNITHFAHPGGTFEFGQYSKVMKIQLITFVVMAIITSRDRLVAMLWVVVGSIAFYGVKGGIFTVLGGGQYTVWGPSGGFFEGNNELALTLLMIIPLMRFLQMQLKVGSWQRHAMTGAMLLCMAAVLGSFSRGALLAAMSMGAFLWLKSRQKLAQGIVVVCVAVIGFTFMPERWHERMMTITDNPTEKDASARGRINAWTFAYLIAKEEPLGGGFGAYSTTNFLKYDPHDIALFDPTDFHDAHSIFFKILAEHGFIGLALFLLVGVCTWFSASRSMRLARRREDLRWVQDFGSMLQVSLVAYVSGGLFLGLAYFDLYYHLVAMVVALGAIVDAELKKAPVTRLPWETTPVVEEGTPRFATMPGVNLPVRR